MNNPPSASTIEIHPKLCNSRSFATVTRSRSATQSRGIYPCTGFPDSCQQHERHSRHTKQFPLPKSLLRLRGLTSESVVSRTLTMHLEAQLIAKRVECALTPAGPQH